MTRSNKAESLRTMKRVVARTQQLAGHLQSSASGSFERRLLDDIGAQLDLAMRRQHPEAEVAAAIAQALVQGRLAWTLADARLHRAGHESEILPATSTILGKLLPIITTHTSGIVQPRDCPAITECLTEIEAPPDKQVATEPSQPQVAHPYDFDLWLGGTDGKRRAKFGVYYTPDVLARHVVRRVDDTLRNHFQLGDGLADTTPASDTHGDVSARAIPNNAKAAEAFVRILDPALGTGIFLVAVMDRIYETLRDKWGAQGLDNREVRQAWNDYAAELLPRLVGREMLLPTAVVAWIRLAEKLSQTGYSWSRPSDIQIVLGDTLQGPPEDFSMPLFSAANPADERISGDATFTVVLGNPPFSALSTNNHPWIEKLLHQSQLAGCEVGSYYRLDGQRLGEKKVWLHDDYVKFLRYAQWQIERAGYGVVGFVTNHGFLDNITFRGMRRSLLTTFPYIEVLDVHGNRKRREVTPDGQRDENVFDIDQGIAVGVFCKPPVAAPSFVRHGDLWGTRASKLAQLSQADTKLTNQSIAPTAPHYFFVPAAGCDETAAEYEQGYSLTEIMPVYTSAAVTARDALAVAFNRRELLARFQQYCDPAVPDEEIRELYLAATRSRRYRTGDTRGWQLSHARETARQAGDLSQLIRSLQYRPFDRRVILWADWLIDWPRAKVSQHMLLKDNLALVVRRQMPPRQTCNFFFVSDTLVIDGVIRSDNCGNESFFPLYVRTDVDGGNAEGGRQANFTDEWIERCRQQYQLQWLPAGTGNLATTIGPDDLLGLIYAQFFSHGYRQRYAHQLRLAFPRIFLPRQPQLLATLCRLGRQLLATHLLHNRRELADGNGNGALFPRPELIRSQDVVIQGGFPHFSGTTLQLSESCELRGLSDDIWQFRVGSHQVCRKWLRDRRGRVLTADELNHFCDVVEAIAASLQLSSAIDSAIEQAGGWPGAWVGR